MKSEVVWRSRLQPFSYGLASLWNALSFRHSPTAGILAYSIAFIILLGVSVLDGSALHQLGLLLLFSALIYALLVAAVRSQGDNGLGIRTLATDEDGVLRVVCGHVARLELLLLAGVAQMSRLRIQQPVLFYVSAMVALFVLGRLGYWLSFSALLWIFAALVLTLPAALSRDWATIPTPEAVGQSVHCAAIQLQTVFSPSSYHTARPRVDCT